MFRKFQPIISVLIVFAVGFSSLTPIVMASDIVPSDDLVGGASVFVFRHSRKRPQEKGTRRSNGSTARQRREQINAQIAANRRKKAAAAKARQIELAKARARERNAKLKLSNTLTARAETFMEKGDLTAAITNFREALKANPKNVDASLGLSEALTVQGIETAGEIYDDAAVAYLDEAVKLNTRNEIAFAKLGEIHGAKNRNSQALVNYEKAVQIDPAFTSVYMPIGLAYVEAGKFPEAETYLTKAEAAGIDSTEAKFARVTILQKQNKHAEALVILDRIAATEPLNAEVQYQRALVFDRMNQTDKAIAAYKDAIRIDPTMSLAWFDLGVIFYNRGEYAEAVKAYQEAIRIDGANAQAHANLASSYRQLEQYPQANASYKAAAEKGINKDPDLYSEWGFCLGKTNEWDKSVARLNTARELSPNAVDNNNLGWGYYNAARVDKENKNDAAATAKLELGKAFLEKAVEQDPKLDAAYLNLGSTNNARGDYQAAVNALNQAIALRSDWVIALNQLGLSYKGLNNLSGAIEIFRRATTLEANNVFGLFSLGEVYHLSGNKKEAKKIQDKLKKINPMMAGRLDNILSGKVVVDEAKRKIQQKVPVRIPF